MTGSQLAQLGKIYNSIRDGIGKPSDYFQPIASSSAEAAPAQAQTQTEKVKARAKAAAAKRSEQPTAAAPRPVAPTRSPTTRRPRA
jgi:hypothetical protein